MTTNLNIEGMTCQMCARHIRQTLERIEGVISARVDLENKTAQVEHNNAAPAAFTAAIEEEGYKATLAP